MRVVKESFAVCVHNKDNKTYVKVQLSSNRLQFGSAWPRPKQLAVGLSGAQRFGFIVVVCTIFKPVKPVH